MTRTGRYKLQYVVVLAVLLGLVAAFAWAVDFDRWALLGLALVCFIPGRISGVLWCDLYRGRRLLGAGRPEESLACSRRFIESMDRHPGRRHLWWLAWAVYTRDPVAMALNNIGAAQLELGRLDEAERSLREALAADPEYPMPHYNLALLAKLRDDPEALREHVERAVELGLRQDVGDRVIQAASGLLARVEGRGAAPTPAAG